MAFMLHYPQLFLWSQPIQGSSILVTVTLSPVHTHPCTHTLAELGFPAWLIRMEKLCSNVDLDSGFNLYSVSPSSPFLLLHNSYKPFLWQATSVTWGKQCPNWCCCKSEARGSTFGSSVLQISSCNTADSLL